MLHQFVVPMTPMLSPHLCNGLCEDTVSNTLLILATISVWRFLPSKNLSTILWKAGENGAVITDDRLAATPQVCL